MHCLDSLTMYFFVETARGFMYAGLCSPVVLAAWPAGGRRTVVRDADIVRISPGFFVCRDGFDGGGSWSPLSIAQLSSSPVRMCCRVARSGIETLCDMASGLRLRVACVLNVRREDWSFAAHVVCGPRVCSSWGAQRLVYSVSALAHAGVKQGAEEVGLMAPSFRLSFLKGLAHRGQGSVHGRSEMGPRPRGLF